MKQSLFILTCKKLKKNKVAMLGVYILEVLYFLAIFADFIAPYSYKSECRSKPYHPPVPIYIFDEEGKLRWPFIYNYTMKMEHGTMKYSRADNKIYPIKFFVKGEPYKIFGIIKVDIHLFGTDEPSRIYLLGADYNGRDIFSRILHGARISLSIGLVAVLISFTIGLLIGGISGYFGGIVDNICMRIVEVFMTFPSFYLILALRAVFPLQMSSVQVYFLMVVIMSLVGWAGLARVVRGIALSLREREYVLSAKAIGASHWRIILTDILPNTASYTIVAATLSIPSYIIAESALSLIGIGIVEPQVSWGNMLADAMNITDMTQHPWLLIPGIFIFLAVLGFNLLGDGLRDSLDPKSVV